MLYLDHAATTPLDPIVREAMMPYLNDEFGNASSLHRFGQTARQAVDESRLLIAQHLECSLDEIIFTSGATESNNLAIKGVLEHHFSTRNTTGHVITSAIEHPSVREVLDFYYHAQKITLTILPVDANGLVSVEDCKNAILPETILVSLQAVNNEIGTIQPLARIGRICQKNTILFHVDAVQAVGIIPVSCESLKCDLLSISAHKIYGPKGIGMLFVRQGVEMIPQMLGGGQERSYRSGTENVAGIVGLSIALEKSVVMLENTVDHCSALQQFAYDFCTQYPHLFQWNGAAIGAFRSVANINIAILPEISGESLVQRLDLSGVAVSLGSACSSGLLKPSPVLLAIGLPEHLARRSLRLTMGRNTSLEDLQMALEIIVKTVEMMK